MFYTVALYSEGKWVFRHYYFCSKYTSSAYISFLSTHIMSFGFVLMNMKKNCIHNHKIDMFKKKQLIGEWILKHHELTLVLCYKAVVYNYIFEPCTVGNNSLFAALWLNFNQFLLANHLHSPRLQGYFGCISGFVILFKCLRRRFSFLAEEITLSCNMPRYLAPFMFPSMLQYC